MSIDSLFFGKLCNKGSVVVQDLFQCVGVPDLCCYDRIERNFSILLH